MMCTSSSICHKDASTTVNAGLTRTRAKRPLIQTEGESSRTPRGSVIPVHAARGVIKALNARGQFRAHATGRDHALINISNVQRYQAQRSCSQINKGRDTVHQADAAALS